MNQLMNTVPETVPETTNCVAIITRGKHAGQTCGHKAIKDDRCKYHQLRSQEQQGCEFVLTRGEYKGEHCNKSIFSGNFCYSHSKDVKFTECVFTIAKGSRKGQHCGRRCKAPETLCTVHRVRNTEPVSVTVLDPITLEPLRTELTVEIVQPVVEQVPVAETVTVLDPNTLEPLRTEPTVEIVQPVVEQVPVAETVTILEPMQPFVPVVEPILDQTPLVPSQEEEKVVEFVDSVPNPDPFCQVILSRGPKKGQKCAKRSCAQHRPKKTTQVMINDAVDSVQETTLSMNYITDQVPGMEYSNSVILFTHKGDILLEPNFEPKYNKETAKTTKLNDRVTVKFDKNKFTVNNRSGNYHLKDILEILYYVYNTCAEAKYTVKITQVVLYSDGRLADNARYVSNI